MSVNNKRMALLCLLIALLAGVTAAAGVFLRGDGTTASAVSIRGEQYDYVTTGVYAYNAERVVAEGVGWDFVTLLFAVPALLLALPGIVRGSLRARLFALGILGYFLYQYLMYAVFWAFGPLFAPFILIYALSAVTIVRLVSAIDISGLPERFTDRFPGKTMAAVSGLMSLALVLMWSQRIAAGYRGDWETAALLGTPTMTVQALDLGIIVPLALATAVLAWRRHTWGYLLAPILAVKGVTMAGAICAMLVSAAFVEGSVELAPLVLFAAATGAFGVLAWRLLGSVAPAQEAASDSVPGAMPIGA